MQAPTKPATVAQRCHSRRAARPITVVVGNARRYSSPAHRPPVIGSSATGARVRMPCRRRRRPCARTRDVAGGFARNALPRRRSPGARSVGVGDPHGTVMPEGLPHSPGLSPTAWSSSATIRDRARPSARVEDWDGLIPRGRAPRSSGRTRSGRSCWTPCPGRAGARDIKRVSEPITHASAGVDTSRPGDKAVELMKAAVARATRPEVSRGLAVSAGMFDASRLARTPGRSLATSTDGVGTRLPSPQASTGTTPSAPTWSDGRRHTSSAG